MSDSQPMVANSESQAAEAGEGTDNIDAELARFQAEIFAVEKEKEKEKKRSATATVSAKPQKKKAAGEKLAAAVDAQPTVKAPTPHAEPGSMLEQFYVQTIKPEAPLAPPTAPPQVAPPPAMALQHFGGGWAPGPAPVYDPYAAPSGQGWGAPPDPYGAQFDYGEKAKLQAEAVANVKAALAKAEEQQQRSTAAQHRKAAGKSWIDPTLSEWPEDDYRIFVGDLGSEVNDEMLAKAFLKYTSFNKAKIVRNKHSGKSKGFGFVSLSDATEFATCMREMNGKYIGNRPCKLSKSSWNERSDTRYNRKRKDSKAPGPGKAKFNRKHIPMPQMK